MSWRVRARSGGTALLYIVCRESRVDLSGGRSPRHQSVPDRQNADDGFQSAGRAKSMAGGPLVELQGVVGPKTEVTAWLSERSLLGVPVPCKLI